VALVGPVSGGLPSFELPDLAGAGALLPAAAGIALMSFIESISAARVFAAKDDPPVDARPGAARAGRGQPGRRAVPGLPGGRGTSQTAINDAAGARTQLAEVVTAGMAMLTLTLLTGLLADLAQPILGAIVLPAAIGLVNLAPLRRIWAIRRRDFWLGLVALAGAGGSCRRAPSSGQRPVGRRTERTAPADAPARRRAPRPHRPAGRHWPP
jgi:SulP family sulfate permease